MANPLRQTMEGTPVHFWTELADVYEIATMNDGYARLADGSLFHIDTLRTVQYGAEFGTQQERLPRPPFVYALTATSSSLFFDFAGVSRNNVIGPLASTQTIRMRGMVARVPLDDIEDGRFTTVEMTIPEVTRWSGLVGVSEKIERYDTGRAKSWQAKTRVVEPLEIDIRRNQKLVLSTTWSVEGPTDKRILATPLEIGSVSDRPLPWREHLQALTAVQDLINPAYAGFVPAEQACSAFQIQRRAAVADATDVELTANGRPARRPKAEIHGPNSPRFTSLTSEGSADFATG